MKRTLKRSAAVLTALLICIPSLLAVLFYTHPMKDASYDLSFLSADGQEDADANGWTVYMNTRGTKTELAGNGTGGYTGLDYAGQTFYFSRNLTETLDSPTLQIGAANRNISVFLDDAMIYTDCPDQDNRIGYLELPMLDYDRIDPLIISLPSDYQGKTLTIAQSSPAYSETQSEADTVWPCDVMLYCGYAYESSLIASAAGTMLPAVLLFALILLLTGAFLWNAFLGSFLPVLPVLTLTVLFSMFSILAKADFAFRYLSATSPDPVWLFFHLSTGILPLFLALYTKAAKPRWFLGALAVLQWISILLYLTASCGVLIPYGELSVFLRNLPQITGFAVFLSILVSSFVLRKNGQRFWIHFNRMLLLLTGCCLIALPVRFLSDSSYPSSILAVLSAECRLLLPNFSLRLVWYLALFSTILSLLLDLLEQETQRRTEVAILKTRNELAISGYENLRSQTEETMMMRHDMTRHYKLLRDMSENAPEKVGAYLDDLLGEIQTQHPVAVTGNQVLDILLNGEIHTAAARGIPVTLLRSEAPAQLPLKDTELCCLIMNILDNAIQAASAPGLQSPFIELDLHDKENHFVFTCRNSALPGRHSEKKAEKNRAEHGYGLKIIHHIMEESGAMYSVKEEEAAYQITIILPL